MNNLYNLEDEEEIDIPSDDENYSFKEKNKNINTETLEQQLQFYMSETERLKSIIRDLNKLMEDHISLRKLLAYQEEQLNRYKKKEKKSKKKNYSISDLIELREKGYSYRRIATKFNVSPSTIHYRLNKYTKNK